MAVPEHVKILSSVPRKTACMLLYMYLRIYFNMRMYINVYIYCVAEVPNFFLSLNNTWHFHGQ